MDFEGWYRHSRPRVAASLAAFSGSVDEASEATDEAFARALARWDRVASMASPEGWVYRVALNVLRRRMRRAAIERRLLPKVARRDETHVMPELEIWDAVRALPDKQRMAVVLTYIADLDQGAIAEVMGVHRGTVASNLSDARRNLGRLIDDEAPGG